MTPRAAWRAIAARLPTRSTNGLAGRLVARADAARDARHWHAAGALYGEALRLRPYHARLHIQCGHMLKEAGDFAAAERHYLAALAWLPNDPDLALQLGHFYKTTARPDEAERAYARALALGASDAADELARLGADHEPSHAARADGPVIAALLPGRHDAAPPRDRLVVHRMGEWTRDGNTRQVLRGVQAVRGWCIASEPLDALMLMLDDAVVRREPLRALPLEQAAGPHQAKYVFNLWHDFSDVAPGEHRIELRLAGRHAKPRSHRAQVMVAPPDATPARLASDAFVLLPPGGTGSVEARVDALPTMVRAARRTLLAGPVRAVLVQRVDQLGDLVCSVPAIERLRALFPDARLVGLVTPANEGLARALGLFDDLVLAPFAAAPGESRRGMRPEAQAALRRTLAAYRFDVAIDLGGTGDSRPLLLLSGAPFLYGFAPRDFPWLSAGLELDAPDPLNRAEAAAHGRKLLALVEGLAALVAERAPIRPRTTPSDAALARHGLAPGDRFVLLHTGARLAFSRWPGFEELARLLLAETDLAVVVMADEPHAPTTSDEPRLRRIAGRLPFDEFDALLASAAVFVGNDSGPKHLASLRGTPVVSLHMARLNWSEWGQEATGTILSRRVPCAGCGIAEHPEECGRAFACLHRITPREVLAAVLDQLTAKETGSRRSS